MIGKPLPGVLSEVSVEEREGVCDSQLHLAHLYIHESS